MPYVEDRTRLDMIVNELKLARVRPNGDLNYVLAKLFVDTIWNTEERSYNNIKNYLGELNECVAEIRRRFLAEHEDNAIEKNGDIL